MPDILSKKQYKDYDSLSRYQSFPFYYNKEDNKYIYGVTSWLDDTTAYVLHIVTQQQESYDYLSYIYYGDPTKYWIICDYNRDRDPLRELEIGEEIKIPSISEIRFKN